MTEPVAAQEADDRSAVERFGPEIAQIVVVLLWASTFIVSKAIFTEVPPMPYIVIRFVLMTGLAFGVMLLRQPKGRRGIERVDLWRFIAVAVTGYTIYQLTFVFGLERTSAFSSSLLVAMVPLFTVLITTAMGEPTPGRAWVGLAIAICGAGIFLWDKRGMGGGTLVGDGLSLLAAVAFAAYGVLARPLVVKYPADTYTAWTILLGSIPLALIGMPATLRFDWREPSLLAWVGIIWMVIFPVYVAYQLWNWAIKMRGVGPATAFGLMVPVASGLLSWLIFGETFGFWKILGGTLVLLGLAVVRLPIAQMVRSRRRVGGVGT